MVFSVYPMIINGDNMKSLNEMMKVFPNAKYIGVL